MARHDQITNQAELHEPKGISGSNAGEVYVANGSGSGAMRQVVSDAAGTELAVEPKGISTAAEGTAYVSDGEGSGAWTFQQSPYIEVYLDTDQTTTATFTTTNTDLGFELSYLTDYSSDFSYSSTTKAITYNGTKTIIAKISHSYNMERTDTGGEPTIEYFIKIDRGDGNGFVELEKSLSARQYSGNDVGFSGAEFLLELNPGDVLVRNLRVDASISIDVQNVLWNIYTISSGAT